MKSDSFDLSSLDLSAPLDGSSFVAEDFVDEDVETLDNTSEIPESDDERAERLAREERARAIGQEAARLDAQFAAEQAERDRLAADKVQQAMKKMRRKRAVLAMVGLIIMSMVKSVSVRSRLALVVADEWPSKWRAVAADKPVELVIPVIWKLLSSSR